MTKSEEDMTHIFDHTVGSHSDDRGGENDRRCDCQDAKGKGMRELYEDLGDLLKSDPTVYAIYMNSQHIGGLSDYYILLEMVKALSNRNMNIQKAYEDYRATDVRPRVLPARGSVPRPDGQLGREKV